MKIDPSKSDYQPLPNLERAFTRQELKHCNQALRRLRFLEHQVRENGGIAGAANGQSGGAVFAELERDAIAWLLVDAGFLPETALP